MTHEKKKFKGMIYPNMAGSYEEALDVKSRKSIWMAGYLRARRTGDRLKGFYRRKHFEYLEQH